MPPAEQPDVHDRLLLAEDLSDHNLTTPCEPVREHVETASAPSFAEPGGSRSRNHRRLMLLPSLACQASCAYCFGPNRGPVMLPGVFEAAADWIAARPRGKNGSFDLRR
jgi:hypothetical protein